MMAASAAETAKADMRGEKAGKTGWLRKAVLVLRLIGKAPGLLVRLAVQYRGFKKEYVRAAMAQGMPVEAARQTARQMRPLEMLGTFRKSRQKDRISGEFPPKDDPARDIVH
jgi:hypothetical protein